MLVGGYFVRGAGGWESTGSGAIDEGVYVDGDGNIVYREKLDPIYVDDNNNVFISEENKNAVMYKDGDKLMVEKVGE